MTKPLRPGRQIDAAAHALAFSDLCAKEWKIVGRRDRYEEKWTYTWHPADTRKFNAAKVAGTVIVMQDQSGPRLVCYAKLVA